MGVHPLSPFVATALARTPFFSHLGDVIAPWQVTDTSGLLPLILGFSSQEVPAEGSPVAWSTILTILSPAPWSATPPRDPPGKLPARVLISTLLLCNPKLRCLASTPPLCSPHRINDLRKGTSDHIIHLLDPPRCPGPLRRKAKPQMWSPRAQIM